MATIDARRPTDEDPALAARLEGHRGELHRHCRRMLGSGFEAEDAVQETLVRAWRAYDRFDGRSSLRTWLYRIASNVCLSMLRGPQRRACAIEIGPSRDGTGASAVAATRGSMTRPADATDPADLVASRDAVRRAFVVALQALPPRQRAVLLLQDVLRWQAGEVAELLGSTEASVRSALQRARATLAAQSTRTAHDGGGRATEAEPGDDAQRRLLTRYVDAFERTDVSTLVALLHLDHTTGDHTTGAPATGDRPTAAAATAATAAA
jgi:RNA polymerase sigma-70 factor (ECF subfamily)